MGTQLQIVEVCLEAIRWPRSRSESPHRLVKILGLASQVHLKRRFLWKWILKWNVKWNLGEPGEQNPRSLGVSLNAPMCFPVLVQWNFESCAVKTPFLCA